MKIFKTTPVHTVMSLILPNLLIDVYKSRAMKKTMDNTGILCSKQSLFCLRTVSWNTGRKKEVVSGRDSPVKPYVGSQ